MFKTCLSGAPYRRLMTIHFSAVGLVVEDLGRSFECYRRLGLDLPTEAPDVPHFEVTTAGGVRLMWDTIESVSSFDPDFEPGQGGPSLAFDCGSPSEVDETYASLVAVGCAPAMKPWDAVWGQRYACVLDPDGHSIDLFAALPD